MDKGIKIAIGLAAVACILAGVMWDAMANQFGDASTSASRASPDNDNEADFAPAKNLLEYHIVGSNVPVATDEQKLTGDIIDTMPALPRPRDAGESTDGSSSSSRAPTQPTASDVRRAQPELGPPGAAAGNGAQEFIEHKVKDGEVLGRISQEYYGTTRYADHIMAFNGITDARKVRVGQTLKIPGNPEGVRLP